MTSLWKTYNIPKDILTAEELSKHITNLTLYPKQEPQKKSRYGRREPKPDPILLYTETNTLLRTPRFYGMEHFGEPVRNNIQKGVDIDVKFTWKLWDDPVKNTINQVPIVDKVLAHFREKGYGGVISLPTGSGKTTMAMKYIADVGKKTLIVVHTMMLLQQWVSRIEAALPGASIGRIAGPTIDVVGKDIVIGMLNSLAIKTYARSVFSEFGLVICDEVHKLGAPVFSKALWKFSHVKLLLGMSATVPRKDEMERVLFNVMGPMIHEASPATNVSRKVTVRTIRFHDGEQKICLQRDGETINFSAMIQGLIDDTKRDIKIKSILKSLIDEGRSVLALSDRVNHVKELTDWVKAEYPDKRSVHYHRKLTTDQQQTVDSKFHCWVGATYHLFSVGMDLSYCDTILLLTPRSSVMQTVGRIRNADGPNKPLIIDFVDMFGCFKAQQYRRRKVYKLKEFMIEKDELPSAKRRKVDKNEFVSCFDDWGLDDD